MLTLPTQNTEQHGKPVQLQWTHVQTTDGFSHNTELSIIGSKDIVHHMDDQEREVMNQVIEGLAKAIQSHGDAVVLAGQNALTNDMRRQGEIMALLSMIVELTKHQGLDSEAVMESFKARRKFFHGEVLQNAEDLDNEMGARLDNRGPDEVSAENNYPPLFP